MSTDETVVRVVLGLALCFVCSCLSAVTAECLMWAWAYERVEQEDALCTQLQYDGYSTGSCDQYGFNVEHDGNLTFDWTQSKPGAFTMSLYEADGERSWELEPGTVTDWGGEARASLPPGGYSLEVCCTVGTDYYVIIHECP